MSGNSDGWANKPVSLEDRKVLSAGLPLGFAIVQKLKEQIWAGKFVDLGDLLVSEDDVDLHVSIDPSAGSSFIVRKSKKHIKTIADWDKAFSIFMAVYTQKPSFVQDLPDLLTYTAEVKNVAELGGDFIFYDHKFRKERAAMAVPYSWAIYRQDLFDKALRLGKLQGKSHYKTNQKFTINKVPKGFCFDYHTPGKRCTRNPCPYKHACPCGRGAHTLPTCRSSGQPAKKPNSGSQQTKSAPSTDTS